MNLSPALAEEIATKHRHKRDVLSKFPVEQWSSGSELSTIDILASAVNKLNKFHEARGFDALFAKYRK